MPDERFNSIIYLFKGVPLDESYDDTFYFDRATESQNTQFNFFYQNFGNMMFTDVSYQRVSSNKIRLQVHADSIRDYNYMCFNNTTFQQGNKHFYAFINKVEYVNEHVCEITYVLDVVQTFYFDIIVEPSFVEREHTQTDVFGEHLVEEGIQFGDLNVTSKKEILFEDKTVGSTFTPMYAIIVYYVPNQKTISKVSPTRDPMSEQLTTYAYQWNYTVNDYSQLAPQLMIPEKASLENNIYFGCDYYALPFDLRSDVTYNYGGLTLTEKDDTKNKITCLINKLDEIQATIVNVCLVPFDVANDNLNNGSLYSKDDYMDGVTTFKNSNGLYVSDTTDTTYTPKNKKMYCYPYKRIVVSNNAGQSTEFKYEDVNKQGSIPQLRFLYTIKGGVVPSCEIIFLPKNYRGMGNYLSPFSDYESGLILNDFPVISWNEDTFKQWWAQNKETYTMTILSSTIMSVAGMMTGGATAMNNIGALKPEASSAPYVARTGMNALSSVDSIVKSGFPFRQAINTPDKLYGQLNTSILKSVLNRVGFTVYELSINADSARAIDSYFTMYGYATKRIKVPNVWDTSATIRPCWNYMKTNGAKVHSKANVNDRIGLSSEYLADIVKIFDHGITFWNRSVEIGDYTQDNSPLSSRSANEEEVENAETR